jgi:hypothetical protein
VSNPDELEGAGQRRDGSALPFVVSRNRPPADKADRANHGVGIETKGAQASARPLDAARLWDAPVLAVARRTLGRYVFSVWAAVDVILVVAIFAFSYGSPFNTLSFFSTAAFLLAILSAISAYGLVHGVVPPEVYLPLAQRYGGARCVGGLALAAALIRAAAYLLLLALCLAFRRFTVAPLGMLLVGSLGLILACAFVATVIIALSAAIAPRAARWAALVLLVLGFASYDAGGPLGVVLLVTRLPLLPFVAAYALGLGDASVWAWLGVLLLLPGTLVGLIILAGYWLRRSTAVPQALPADKVVHTARES